MGLSYALVTADLFHIFLKLFIGGLRPNFYDVCQPVPSLPGAGFHGTYFTPAICTTTDTHALNYAMMSFPSGHSTAAFASSVFLAL
jgi:membrane-associated phospholipid phosphatase